MNDQQIEQEIKARGLDVAPRVTKEHIDVLMARVSYIGGRVGETTSTLVHAFLDGEFLLSSGHSACVSAANFNAELGFDMAKDQAEQKARAQLWQLEGYALRKRLAEQPKDFRDRVRAEVAELDGRIDKLSAFTTTSIFAALPDTDQSLLLAQQAAMLDYSGCLHERIKAFS